MVVEKPRKPRFGAKTEFVRSLDRSLSAAEVVALAQKKGLRLTPAFVYNIRSAEASVVERRFDGGKDSTGARQPHFGERSAQLHFERR
jgi:hypothetical protein